ncbi:hypothetical protein [Legionella sp. W05-934-2]|uniref:hypothetical protein n=1 Tax=Legionella sp. W05-934-2 TaxID=1198649 RepID=UPI00346182B2
MPKEHRVLVTDEGGRKIFVVNQWPFYISTGQNSHAGGTPFPFNGASPLKLIKPIDFPFFSPKALIAQSKKYIDQNFPPELAAKMQEKRKDMVFGKEIESAFPKIDQEILIRFGNIKGMVLSMYIGGGFWDQEHGKELKSFIEEKYPDYCAHIKEQYKTELEEARQIIIQPIEQEKIVEHLPDINHFLMTQGVNLNLDEAARGEAQVVNVNVDLLLQEVSSAAAKAPVPSEPMKKDSSTASPSTVTGSQSEKISNIIFKDRQIVVIGGYPFYCSSGINSGMASTFLPFDGINGTQYQKPVRYVGDKTAPELLKFFQDSARQNFPEDIVQLFESEVIAIKTDDETSSFRLNRNNGEQIKHDSYEQLTRFGNMETLVLSMLIGGGFWEEDKGRVLAQLLQQRYGTFCDEVKSKHQATIQQIHQLKNDSSSTEIVEAEQEVNNFLKSQITDYNPSSENMANPYSVNKQAKGIKERAQGLINNEVTLGAIIATASAEEIERAKTHLEAEVAQKLESIFDDLSNPFLVKNTQKPSQTPSNHSAAAVGAIATTPSDPTQKTSSTTTVSASKHAFMRQKGKNEAMSHSDRILLRAMIIQQTCNFPKGRWTVLMTDPKVEVGISKGFNRPALATSDYILVNNGEQLLIFDKNKKNSKGELELIQDSEKRASVIKDVFSNLSNQRHPLLVEAHLYHVQQRLAQLFNHGNGPDRKQWSSLTTLENMGRYQFNESIKTNWEFGRSDHTGNLAFATLSHVNPGFLIEFQANGEIMVYQKNQSGTKTDYKPLVGEERASALESLSNCFSHLERADQKAFDCLINEQPTP